MDITPQARERLARYMEERADYLRLSWREVALRAGIGIETLRLLRTVSDGVRPTTLRGIDDALEWEPGSARRVVSDSGEPVPIAPSRGGRMDGYTIGTDGNRHYFSPPLQRIWDDPDVDDELAEALIARAEQWRLENIRRNGGDAERSA